jgi:hypothetical protein
MTSRSQVIVVILFLLVLSSICAPVTANNPPEVFISKSMGSAVVGQQIIFDASKSRDPEGGGLTFSWYFADDDVEKSGATVSYAYSTPGTKTIGLTVTDDQGAQTISSAVLHVTSVQTGETLKVQVTETTTPEGNNETIQNLSQVTPAGGAIITMAPRTVLTNDAGGQSSGGTGSAANQLPGSAGTNAGSPAGPPILTYLALGAVGLVAVVLGGIVFVKRQR